MNFGKESARHPDEFRNKDVFGPGSQGKMMRANSKRKDFMGDLI